MRPYGYLPAAAADRNCKADRYKRSNTCNYGMDDIIRRRKMPLDKFIFAADASIPL